jgi:hypothetical protein
MKLLGLPGRNIETERWLRSVLDALRLGATSVEVVHYRHWDVAGEPDVVHEAQRLRDARPDLLVAKSLGTMVSIEAFARCDFAPRRAVFIGTPLRAYGAPQLAALRAFAVRVPTLFIQQTGDVAGAFADVARTVSGIAGSAVAEVAGSDHVYSNVVELTPLIEGWHAGPTRS